MTYPARPRHPGTAAPLGEGEKILLIDRKGRRYFVLLTAGKEFHFHGGIVRHDALIGRPEGSRVRSAKGLELLALRPTAAEWTVKAPRGAQVVYPKDQAMIVALADVAPGVTVVEAGAGSGALTATLLRAVGGEGRVLSFELRDDHADIAERNITDRFGGIPTNWELRRGDVVAGLADVSCDRVILDLLEPWLVVDAACHALHPGGILLAYTPTVPQVMRLREALSADARWGLAETVEVIVRPWHVEGLAVRPEHRMVAHTAFLTTARRLPAEAPPAEASPAEASPAEASPPRVRAGRRRTQWRELTCAPSRHAGVPPASSCSSSRHSPSRWRRRPARRARRSSPPPAAPRSIPTSCPAHCS